MRDFLSNKAKTLKPSGIRKFFDLATKKQGVISLGVGEPDFSTPWNIRDAGITILKKGYTQYTSNRGLPELLKEISLYLGTRFSIDCKPENIVVTVGASEAIDLTLRAIVDNGDEILIPDPSYVSYKPCVELCGGVAVPIRTDGDNGFIITPENLERAITDKTKAIVFPYPNNPTGGIMGKEDIIKLIPVIIKHDLLVIADEIYAELTYGIKHTSIASFPELAGRIVYINGFSKAFAMTGWRIGFVVADEPIISAILKIHQYTAICAPVFSQYAVTEGLKQGRLFGYSFIEEMRNEYNRRRNFMYKTFSNMGLYCFEPKGGFYIFPKVIGTGLNGEQFATRLLEEENVAVVPGNAFGEFGENYIRVSYAYSMDKLVKATDKIKEFLDKLKDKE